MSTDDVKALAEHKGLTVDEFGRKYLIRCGTRLSLGENSRGHCVMLGEDNRCSVYDIRPRQCRSFPFWRRNVKTRENWEELTDLSPGINKGRLYTTAEIQKIMHEGGQTGASENED